MLRKARQLLQLFNEKVARLTLALMQAFGGGGFSAASIASPSASASIMHFFSLGAIPPRMWKQRTSADRFSICYRIPALAQSSSCRIKDTHGHRCITAKDAEAEAEVEAEAVSWVSCLLVEAEAARKSTASATPITIKGKSDGRNDSEEEKKEKIR